MVKNFNYDGAGPDAFFWVGTEGHPDKNVDESKTAVLAHPFQGVHYAYRDATAPVLKAASNEQITLILPPHMKVSELTWFSVWCRKFTVDFGSLEFDGSSLNLQVSEPDVLPPPILSPSNTLDNSSPEPEPETEPEVEPEPSYEHEDGSNSIGEPESEPSTKGEPEPEPKGSSTVVTSSLLSILLTLILSLTC